MLTSSSASSPSSASSVIRNAMTIDVEDYFQVSAFSSCIARDDWPHLPCRVENNVDRILALLDEKNIKATFFTLGWIAERFPAMIRKIVGQGHELASHGYAHRRASEQSVAEFQEDIASSKDILEALGGQQVRGYRAPSFSIGTKNLWALDVLLKAGYQYSSSIYPIQHDHYGMPHAPRFSFYPNGQDGILELPITTVRMMNRNFPAGGGGYFRLFPYQISRWLMRRVNQRDHQSCIFYFHPWEIDPEQPRPQHLGAKTRFRHYVNLSRTESRLKSLTQDFQWDRIDRIFLSQQ